ncbi:recombinase family protein [Sulfurimonas sp.]|jgi:DNA invertase Pin-like site-specific DNA recombinase|uniref:recombinase family protein n=1 Tax=Sulfurimonas sp. TaxID=2022749 RepID=UPI002A36042D|nr:recombinase family protein [Sulfurimonas sp.]MDY0122951.1 recombinase family protein [Sulfurimonas sp.]
MHKKIGYIRATNKEEIEEQSELLIAAGCSKIYVEPKEHLNYQHKVKLAQVIEILKSKDTLAVTRLSILSSSVQTLLELMFTLEEKEIILEATKQQYISSSNYSLDELLFFLSEFIEDIRVEKQAYGISKAKQECRRLGRPPKLSAKEVLKAIELKQTNTSQQVANRFGVGRSTLYRHIAKYKEAS